MAVTAGIDIGALLHGGNAPLARTLRVEHLARDELDRDWDAAHPRRVSVNRDEKGRDFLAIDADSSFGYRLYAPRHGTYLVSSDGARARCAPPRGAAWRWHRLVIAQLLPLAAVLQGAEIFHASAVVFDGAAAAFVGASGAGKTSVALHSVLSGASFLTDDVLAVDRSGDGIRAYPGSAIARVHFDELDALPPARRRALPPPVAKGEKAHFRLPAWTSPVRLGLMYYLERGRGNAGITIDEVRGPDPWSLLGSSLLPYVRSPERLRNQLAVCAALADGVRVLRVRSGPTSSAAEMADAIGEHARAVG